VGSARWRIGTVGMPMVEKTRRDEGRVKWPSSPAKLLLNFHRIDADSLGSSPANWFGLCLFVVPTHQVKLYVCISLFNWRLVCDLCYLMILVGKRQV
jgi:hypothetical protein